MAKTAVRAKKAVAKKATAKKTVAKKVVAKKAAARKPAAKKASAPKSPLTTRKAAVAKGPVKKAAGGRLPAHLKVAIAAAQDKQAVDLTVLDLRSASAFTDFFIVCTGNNSKQVQAIADGIEAALKAAGERPALVEGYNKGEWILLDYFDFIVHIFLPAQRSFYALERLWGGAEPIEVSAP